MAAVLQSRYSDRDMGLRVTLTPLDRIGGLAIHHYWTVSFDMPHDKAQELQPTSQQKKTVVRGQDFEGMTVRRWRWRAHGTWMKVFAQPTRVAACDGDESLAETEVVESKNQSRHTRTQKGTRVH